MSLVIGTILGPYEVTGSLGAGGMGEVYRARDAKLGRDVALKVLPAALASDPDRRSRFEREAKTLAALNHPHIAHIYGFEQSGSTAALVMELVEGEDLSQRLTRGTVPLDEALALARQIAAALEAAHEQGIVHRDLKPANIKLRPDGTVKVLDFGLAKAVDRASDMTSPAITEAGIVLGTAAYMSPEQARGKTVDKRADIWSFGVVLYEMLSGRRLFDGATVSDSLAAVLTRDPEWSHLPKATPPRIVDLLQRCLRKDPARRLRDIGDAAVEIDDVLAGSSANPAVTPATDTRAPRLLMPWVIAAVMTLVASGAFWLASRERPTVDRTPARVALPLPSSATMFLGRGSSVAISPNGQQVVFTATAGNRTQLYVRSLNRMEITPLPGTDGAANPFFSPDGQWVGFSAGGKLKKVNLQGGAVATLADAPNIRGEAWGPDDSIVFTPNNATSLWRVPASGGTAAPLTTLGSGELSHRWPQVVSGGRAVVFTIWNDTGFDGGRIAVQRLDGGERRVLVQGGGFGRIVEIDERRAYLVYAQAQGLMAAPFDLDRLELTGAVTPVIDAVASNLSGGAHFAFSQTGSLVFLPGSLAEVSKTLLWVDRTGKETVVSEIDGMSVELSITRDARRVVRINTQGPDRDVWVEDLERHVSTRLTSGGFHSVPILTPDDRRAIYASGLPNRNLFWKSLDGVGEEERLTTSQNQQVTGSVSPDGKTLAYVEYDPLRNADIWLVSLEGDHAVRPFLQTPSSEGHPAISPDGRSIAYQSNQSGRFETYATSFPQPGTPVQVSTAGGIAPIWSRDGRELFYRNGDRMMAVPIVTEPEITIGAAQMLFSGNYLGAGDLARDTGRFLMLRDNGQEAAGKTIYLVMNWFDELLSKVPIK